MSTITDAAAISIIVPVYNTSPFLTECIDSILVQSFPDWELFLIDDGSTDDSATICDNYAALDSRITCIHQANKGPSSARNKGLDMSHGEFIAFADADDVIFDPLYLEILYNIAKDNSLDICISMLMRFNGVSPRPESSEVDLTFKVCSGPDFCGYRYPKYRNFFGSVYSKLFRRSLFDRLRFPEGLVFAEDNAIAHHLYYPCDRIALIDRKMYGYRLGHSGQYMRVDMDQKMHDLEVAFSDRERYYSEQGREDLAQEARLEKNRHIAQALRMTLGKK